MLETFKNEFYYTVVNRKRGMRYKIFMLSDMFITLVYNNKKKTYYLFMLRKLLQFMFNSLKLTVEIFLASY